MELSIGALSTSVTGVVPDEPLGGEQDGFERDPVGTMRRFDVYVALRML